jgi:SAM-dependent methyltransferase
MRKTAPTKSIHDLAHALIHTWRQIVKSPGPIDFLQTREFRLCVQKVIDLSQQMKSGHSLQASWLSSPMLGAFMVYYWPIYYQEAHFLIKKNDKALGRVLDLASGPGPFTLAALENGAKEVFAADANERCLMILSEFVARLGHTLNVRAWNYPKPFIIEGSFDTIFLGHSLLAECECEPQKAFNIIKEIVKILAPGGRILILENYSSTHKRTLQALFDLIKPREKELRIDPLELIENFKIPLERTQLMIDIMRSIRKQEMRKDVMLLQLQKNSLSS